MRFDHTSLDRTSSDLQTAPPHQCVNALLSPHEVGEVGGGERGRGAKGREKEGGRVAKERGKEGRRVAKGRGKEGGRGAKERGKEAGA